MIVQWVLRAQAPPWFPGQWRSGWLEGDFCTLSTSHILSHRWGHWEELAGDMEQNCFFFGVNHSYVTDFIWFPAFLLKIKRSESRCLEALCIMPSGDPFAATEFVRKGHQGPLIKLDSKRKGSWQSEDYLALKQAVGAAKNHPARAKSDDRI